MKQPGFEELWKRARIAVYIQRQWQSKLDETISFLEDLGRPETESDWEHFTSLVEDVRVYTEHVDDASVEIEAVLGG